MVLLRIWVFWHVTLYHWVEWFPTFCRTTVP